MHSARTGRSKGDESEGSEKEPEAGGRGEEEDRWPFQTMRNSGDKGGTEREGREWKETACRERMRAAERLRESERKVEGKIGAAFSRKGRAGRNNRWRKTEKRGETKREAGGCHGEEKRMENG